MWLVRVGADGAAHAACLSAELLRASGCTENDLPPWQALPGLRIAPCAPLTLVERGRLGALDLFAVGVDGRVHVASKPAHGAGWTAWWPVGPGTTVLHAHLTVVPTPDTREEGAVDVVFADERGTVCAVTYDTTTHQGAPLRRIGKSVAPPGAPVAAARNGTGGMTLFVVGECGRVLVATDDEARGRDAAWAALEGLRVAPRTPITALGSSPGRVELFVAAPDGRLFTTSIDASRRAADRTAVGDVTLPPRTEVTAVLAPPPRRRLAVLTPGDGVLWVSTRSPAGAWSARRSLAEHDEWPNTFHPMQDPDVPPEHQSLIGLLVTVWKGFELNNGKVVAVHIGELDNDAPLPFDFYVRGIRVPNPELL